MYNTVSNCYCVYDRKNKEFVKKKGIPAEKLYQSDEEGTHIPVKFTENEFAELKKQYEDYKARGLSLDMSRGKPCTEQLDLSEPLLADIVTNQD